MYYKVVVKEMKKTTVACDACKKRKGKCTGTSPCTRCAEANIPCTYLQGNKKRGPVSKKQKTAQSDDNSCLVDGTSPVFYLGNDKLIANRESTVVVHSRQVLEPRAVITGGSEKSVYITEEGDDGEKNIVEYKRSDDRISRSTLFHTREAGRKIGLALASAYYETGLSNGMERNYLVELFTQNMTFTDTLDEIESLRQKLLTPKTSAQEMKVRAVMAFMARGLGQSQRAEQFASDARTLANQAIDDASLDAAEAFHSLSAYYAMTDYRNTMFLNMAFGITKWIAQDSEQARRLHHYSTIATTIIDKSTDIHAKRKLLKVHSPTILAGNKKPGLKDLLLAAVIKLYCALAPSLLERLHVNRMHELKDVRFSQEEAASMLEDVSFLEQLICQHSPQKALILVLKVTKILILWRSGDIGTALSEADAIIDWDNFEPYKYLSWTTTLISEVPHNFWALSFFYAQIGQTEKARKVYSMFTTISKLYGQHDPNGAPAPFPPPSPPQLTLPIAKALPTTTTSSTSSIKKEEDMFDVPRLLHMYSNNLHTNSNNFVSNAAPSEIINVPYIPNNPTPLPPTTTTVTTPPMYHTPSPYAIPVYSPQPSFSTYASPSSPSSEYNSSPSPPQPVSTYTPLQNSTTPFLSHDVILGNPPPLPAMSMSNIYPNFMRDEVGSSMYNLLEEWLLQ